MWVERNVFKFLLAKMSLRAFYSKTLNWVSFFMFSLMYSSLISSPANKQPWPSTSWKILTEISVPEFCQFSSLTFSDCLSNSFSFWECVHGHILRQRERWEKMKMIFLSRCTRLLLFLILFKKYLFIYYFIIFGCAGSLVLCGLSLVAARAAL